MPPQSDIAVQARQRIEEVCWRARRMRERARQQQNDAQQLREGVRKMLARAARSGRG